MTVASQNEIAADFAEYVKAAKAGPVVVMSKGKPVAVLLRTEGEEDLERLLMGHSRKLQAILEAARKRFRAPIRRNSPSRRVSRSSNRSPRSGSLCRS